MGNDKYKLIAIDMDGTVLNKKNISSENRKWIQAAVSEGIVVMFATGREVEFTLTQTLSPKLCLGELNRKYRET
jgi:hydroxymethylpyrimidine pyrophosphatase-like HAD family hydrolase